MSSILFDADNKINFGLLHAFLSIQRHIQNILWVLSMSITRILCKHICMYSILYLISKPCLNGGSIKKTENTNSHYNYPIQRFHSSIVENRFLNALHLKWKAERKFSFTQQQSAFGTELTHLFHPLRYSRVILWCVLKKHGQHLVKHQMTNLWPIQKIQKKTANAYFCKLQLMLLKIFQSKKNSPTIL